MYRSASAVEGCQREEGRDAVWNFPKDLYRVRAYQVEEGRDAVELPEGLAQG